MAVTAVLAYVVLVASTSGVLCAHWLYVPRRATHTRKDQIT
ncbi:hypothetical protein [Streptomyces sp. NPDC049590]